jgi:hypothetical protein
MLTAMLLCLAASGFGSTLKVNKIPFAALLQKIRRLRFYPTFAEKSVSAINVESTFSTSFPLSSLLLFTCCHSGSS